jgi:hypothetical protein
MASTQLPEAAAYLTDAAHLLRTQAPETAAHLMAYRNDLLVHHDLSASDIQRQRICGACGNIHVAGLGSQVSLRRRATVAPKKAKRPAPAPAPRDAAPGTGPVKVVSCGFCSRETKTEMAAPGPAVRRKSRHQQPKTKEAAPLASEGPRPSANATSKKRAKNRKAGLQALLAGQQQQQSPSALSLADFMKK